MPDTTFTLTGEQHHRLVRVYEFTKDETLVDVSHSDPQLATIDATNGVCAGAAGLHGILDDYDRFAQMLGNGGTLDGARVLQPAVSRRCQPTIRWRASPGSRRRNGGSA